MAAFTEKAVGLKQRGAADHGDFRPDSGRGYVPARNGDYAPSGRRIVKLTWACKTKRDGREKARLCVQGCTQVAGIDYDQTFCAAMRSGSLRLLCFLAARLELKMHRWDFVAAYLQGSLLEGEEVALFP